MSAAESSSATPVAIELAGVEKTFRSRHDQFAAVRGVDLAIHAGEFFSLLGPSGCGKTTTLRMIAGFEQPSCGRVLLHGTDVTAAGPDQRDVNMVFQNYALFPHLNVRDNIAFGLRRRKVPRGVTARRVAEITELVQLGGLERRMPRELSGGQQQRVALARALVNSPRALLLDEPLGALDLKLRQIMQIELKRIQRELGITFVYVTHDQGEALTMSDRLAVMRDGRIEQLGTPRQVYDEPASAFVAGFIGASNILAGRVSRLVDGIAVIEVAVDERVMVHAPEGLAPGGQLAFTVRPEKITVHREMPDRDCRLRGQVTEVIFLGTSTTYVISTELAAEVLVFRQNDESVQGLDRGETIWLSWRTPNARPFASAAAGELADS